jgi:hypothetical protein
MNFLKTIGFLVGAPFVLFVVAIELHPVSWTVT